MRPTLLSSLVFAAGAAFLSTAAPAGPGEPAVAPGQDPGGVAVALIDTGVNYTLPQIAARLARDAGGALLGYDFHDDDAEPFDLVPGAAHGSGRHHGTSVAGILIGEAPKVRLVPYRFRANAGDSFAHIVEHMAKGPARIAAMPLGGYRKDQWEALGKAMAAHREILFIVSAGNEGHNLEQKPIYPASFALPNILVVASTDDFGRFPPGSNWGVKSVDISTPGEGLQSIGHNGGKRLVSGSSFAVPRIAALAARLAAHHPGWDALALKREIVKLAAPSPGEREPRTKYGWIPNPALAGPAPR